MNSASFDSSAWRSVCHNLEVACADRALSPMHALFIFSQAIDDALQDIDMEHVGQAFDIARAHGYESSLERADFVNWFATENARTSQQTALRRA
jgi:hypothetical protein